MNSQLETFLRLARRQMRRVQARLRHGGAQVPLLFANSFPKSGTHLLTQILAAFTQLGPFVESGLPALTMYDGKTAETVPQADLLRQFARFRGGDISYGHLHATPEIVSALCQPGIAPFFILRDPRDVVVSHVFYVTDLAPNHAHHAYYTEQLSTFEERLRVSILGLPEIDVDFPDIRQRFLPFTGWLNQDAVLTLHFEKLITDRGAALARILDYVIARGFDFKGDKTEAIRTLAGGVDPASSPTFRSGKVGGWKEHFTPESKALFKEVAGDLLITLGYEEDLDW